MHRLLPVGLFLLFAIIAQGQNGFKFKLLRHEEDYSFLKSDTARFWYYKMKYMPLGKKRDSYLSLGGDIRYQVFYFKNQNWGAGPEDDDGYVLSRFLAHADLHVSQRLRTFVQLQSSLAAGKAVTSPVDENALDLQQAFIDYTLPVGHTGGLTFRLGRQELLYGSERLVSVGEGLNNRQAFDAAKAIFKGNQFAADIFYSHHVRDQKGLFDDGFNKDVKFFGSYIVMNNVPFLKNVDLYYLGLWKKEALFDDGAGTELRHSIGSRIWDNGGNWRYDFEGVFQFGEFSGKRIRAWTVSFNTGYQFQSAKWRPEIGLKSELISGDKNYGDYKLQTFNPLFPRGAYFGLAALIGPVNLFDIHPSVTLTLIKNKLAAAIDYDVFWRFSENDGLYGPNAALVFSGNSTREKFIGDQLLLHLNCTPNPFLSFRLESTWFRAGDFLKVVSPGKDILFMGVTAQLKY